MIFRIPLAILQRGGVLITILLAPVSGLAADTSVYRYVDENGVVSFSATPPPSAAEVQQIDVIERNTITHEPPTEAQRKAKKRYQEVTSRLREREEAQREKAAMIAAAQRELEERKKALEQGAEPLPGERAGTVTGGSRLLPTYFARIKKLEQGVKEAQDALDKLLRQQ